MRWAAALLVLGALLRFGLAWTEDELRDDERYRYLEVARHLRAGEGFSIAGQPTAQTLPLWPLLLAALADCVKPQLLAALLSSAAVALGWVLARRLSGARVALATLALLAIDPDGAKLGGTVLTEPLFTYLLLLFALAWVEKRLLFAAVALGLGALVRPEAALVPFALALCAREWKRPALLLGAVVLALAPWAVRNAVVFDAFVPFTTTGGITLNAGMNETEEELPFRKQGQGRGKRFRHALVMARERTEVTDDRELARQAVDYALAHPGQALRITAAKAVQLWTPLQRKGSSAVYALAVLGCWWAFWRRTRFPVPLVGPLLAVMTFVGLVFLAIPRYRVPYHPYVFLLACEGVLRSRAAGAPGQN